MFWMLIIGHILKWESFLSIIHANKYGFKFQMSRGKVMPSVFWYEWGILLVHYLRHVCTSTGSYYARIFPMLPDVNKIKKCTMLPRNNLFPRGESPKTVSQTCVSASIIPTNSLDLELGEFNLFSYLKKFLWRVVLQLFWRYHYLNKCLQQNKHEFFHKKNTNFKIWDKEMH